MHDYSAFFPKNLKFASPRPSAHQRPGRMTYRPRAPRALWRPKGEVAERSIVAVSKTVVRETVPRVRIPPSPQDNSRTTLANWRGLIFCGGERRELARESGPQQKIPHEVRVVLLLVLSPPLKGSAKPIPPSPQTKWMSPPQGGAFLFGTDGRARSIRKWKTKMEVSVANGHPFCLTPPAGDRRSQSLPLRFDDFQTVLRARRTLVLRALFQFSTSS